MAREISGLAYPDRFYAAAAYAGFGGSPNPSNQDIASRFSNDVALILYALYQQATVGPCNVPKPSLWNPVELGKWRRWQQLGNMVSTEAMRLAMRLFVKILEEEEPGWFSRASNSGLEPVADVQMNHNSIVGPIIENGNSIAETTTITAENGGLMETQDKDVVSEGLGSVVVYDQWISPPITGQRLRDDMSMQQQLSRTRCIYMVEITMVVT
ncbi:Acyl-CoA binding protein 4 isoform 3 [Hibiscus syriacus]|uniref:Acyl-CoA binding protein 4 isoform 3 n=1 Tax=Hibiscus syriacus TaxID=106335 RepID=A0A6A3B4E4_HIBSY|nr:Acyl-CoA binding protein 4 isoform 3 [Hibiscus syriacus]